MFVFSLTFSADFILLDFLNNQSNNLEKIYLIKKSYKKI